MIRINPNRFLPGLMACCALGLSAQGMMAQTDSLEMDVTFVGKRQMEVRDAVKLSAWPTAKALGADKPTLTYALLTKRLNFTPTMTPVEPTRLRVDEALPRLYRGFARGSVGTRGTTTLDLSYTDLRSREGSWGTAFHHAATNSPSSLLNGRVSENGLGAWGTRFVGKERVDVEGTWARHGIPLYGFDSLAVDTAFTPIDAPRTVWSEWGARMTLKSHLKDSTDINHEVDASWSRLSNEWGARERTVKVEANLSSYLNNERIDLDLRMQFDNYNLDSTDTFTQGVVQFTPSVTSKRGAFLAKVGLGLALDADVNSRDGQGDSFHMYPQAEVRMNLLRNLFVPYARLGGELQANNLHSTLSQNPFFSPTFDRQTLANLDGTAWVSTNHWDGWQSTNKRLAFATGIRGTVTQVFRFHAYLNTAQYEDLQLFRNVLDADGTNEFQAFYETVGIRTLGGEAEFDLGTLWKFQGGIEFYGYNMAESSEDERPWNMPPNRWNASATYNVIDGLNVSADAVYTGGRDAFVTTDAFGEVTPFNGGYVLEMPGYLDLNMTANYTYNERLGAWVTLANIANSKYTVWGGYPVQGFQFLTGLHYAF